MKLALNILLFSTLVFSQDTVRVYKYYNDINLLLENSDESSTNEQVLIDELEQLRNNPVSIQTAKRNELAKIPFFTSAIVRKIMRARDTLGITSAKILQEIISFDDRTMQFIQPCISFKKNQTNTTWLPQGYIFRSRINKELQQTKGFSEHLYGGNTFAVLKKIYARSTEYSAGLLFQQDAGEIFSHKYLSGFFEFHSNDIVEKILIGNYSINIGEGLLLSRASSISKSGNPVSQIKKRNAEIVSHLSSDEFHYFQGVAASFTIERWHLLSFYSDRNLPATIDDNETVHSFYTTGLFRTDNEIKKMYGVREQVSGVSTAFEFNRTDNIGVSLINFRYDKAIENSLLKLSRNESSTLFSTHAAIIIDEALFFGEAAMQRNSNASGLVGMLYKVSRHVSLSFHARLYANNYKNPFAYPFGENNGITNDESGRYIGIEVTPNTWCKFSSFYDEFALKSASAFQLMGSEKFLRSELYVNKQFQLYLQHRNKSKEIMNTSEVTGFHFIEKRMQQNYKLGYTFRVLTQLELAQRYELVNTAYSISAFRGKGMLLTTEVSTRNSKSQLWGTVRATVFDTDSYDSRLYHYEKNVEGGYANPPLFGQGTRWYIVLGYDISSAITFSFKFSETNKVGVTELGSGDDVIQGNLDDQLTVQLDVVL